MLEFLGREIVSQFSRVLGMLTKDDSNNCIVLNSFPRWVQTVRPSENWQVFARVKVPNTVTRLCQDLEQTPLIWWADFIGMIINHLDFSMSVRFFFFYWKGHSWLILNHSKFHKLRTSSLVLIIICIWFTTKLVRILEIGLWKTIGSVSGQWQNKDEALKSKWISAHELIPTNPCTL